MASVERVCAWCTKSLGKVDCDPDPRYPITHGICESCSRRVLEAGAGVPLQDFLDGIDVPILLISDDLRVTLANRRAREALGREFPVYAEVKAGDAIECVNARAPGGCGSTPACGGCAIRAAVRATYETGRPCAGVRAEPTVRRGAGAVKLSLKVTTEKVGDCVMLSLDEDREG